MFIFIIGLLTTLFFGASIIYSGFVMAINAIGYASTIREGIAIGLLIGWLVGIATYAVYKQRQNTMVDTS